MATRSRKPTRQDEFSGVTAPNPEVTPEEVEVALAGGPIATGQGATLPAKGTTLDASPDQGETVKLTTPAGTKVTAPARTADALRGGPGYRSR